MELENLRTIWRSVEDQRGIEDHHSMGENRLMRERTTDTTGQERNLEQERVDAQERIEKQRLDRQIMNLLTRGSRGPVAKMKRNLLRELILMLVLYVPTILFYFFGFGGKLPEMGWLLLALMVLFAGYAYRKNKLLDEMQCVSCAVRSNIERQVITLRKYLRFYALAGTILLPVMALLSFFVAEWKLPVLAGDRWWNSVWIWAIVLGLVTVASYFLNMWNVNKLYGRHIERLEELLREMNEEPEGGSR
jgi:hypothetical protein